MRPIQTLIVAVLLASCATGPNYYANPLPVDMSPQAIMARGTCTDLPVDHYGTANPAGWATKPPAGMMAVSCGSKYASGAFYCANPATCGELVWTSNPSELDRGKVWHGIVDLVGAAPGASLTACAEAANRFGWSHGIDCVPVPLVFNGKGARGIFPVTVPPLAPGSSVQTSPNVIISIRATGTVPIVIGQVGFAEQTTEPPAPGVK